VEPHGNTSDWLNEAWKNIFTSSIPQGSSRLALYSLISNRRRRMPSWCEEFLKALERHAPEIALQCRRIATGGFVHRPRFLGGGFHSMVDKGEGSVTVWLASLKSGKAEAEAAQKLWHRYFEALVRLARDRLHAAPKAMADEEDAALSAFDSFIRGAARGRYPQLDDRDDLWRLLVVITERKALDQARHEHRQKRGGKKIRGRFDQPDADKSSGGLADLAAPEPTPEFAAQVADECRRLLVSLRDESLRVIARLRMEGYSNKEVAEQLGCSLRTVARKVELIRRTWLEETGIAS
jgi:RNA polymerase sigma factor (sigma-70 family)